MRKTLVVFVVLTMLFSVVPVAMGAFEDAPKASHWAYDNFALLYNAGLLKGYPDGTFKGERYATRYEMVELTARIMQYLESEIVAAGGTLPENGGRVALTEEQAKELIRQALAEKDYVTRDELEQQTDDVYDALRILEEELWTELNSRNDVNISFLESRVDTLEATVEEQGTRLDAVEQQTKSNKTLNIVALILGVAGIVFGFVPSS
jgi:hypothetical protein